MENEAFGRYRDYPRQHRTLERILQKLWDQDLPGAPYVEQYLRHMHRRGMGDILSSSCQEKNIFL